MNKEQIKQIVHEVLRDPRLGSGVAAAAPAPSRTEMVFPVLRSMVHEDHGVPPQQPALRCW
jgi:hypothetical protein